MKFVLFNSVYLPSCYIVLGALLNAGDREINSALACPPGPYSLGVQSGSGAVDF